MNSVIMIISTHIRMSKLLVGLCLVGMFISAAKGETVFRDDFNTNPRYPDFTKWTTVSFRPQLFQILQNSHASNITVERESGNSTGVLSLTLDIDDSPGLLLAENRVPVSSPKNNETTSVEIEFRARLPYENGVLSTVYLSPSSCTFQSCLLEYPKIVLIEGKKIKKDEDVEQGSTLNFYGYYEDDTAPNFQGVMKRSVNFSHDMYQDFHVFRLSWKLGCLHWYVDDQMVLSVCSALMMPHVDMSLNFQIERAKEWMSQYPYYEPKYAPVYPPSSLEIDYVKIERLTNLVDPLRTTDSNPGDNSVAASNTVAVIVPAIVVPVICMAVCILLILIIRRRRTGTNISRATKRMRKEEKDNELYDLPQRFSLAGVKRKSNDYTLWETQDAAIKEYLRLFAVPSDRIQTSLILLGKGEFGTVFQALVDGLHGRIGPVEVAVKTMTMKDAHTSNYIQKAFEDEIRVMLKAGQHLNVVNLLGVTISEYPALLLELCELGSLLSYLQARRPPYGTYTSLLNGMGELENPDGSFESSRHDDYSVPLTETTVPVDKSLSTKDLMSFSYQVCRGLEYLASRSIIHRDIAARNVLITKHKIAKVSDFGMAKFREKNYILTNASHVTLPIRWMAPEAIRSLTFSESSDVWAFGVLLWEVFSLGQTPYSGVPISGRVQDFADWLVAGNCLSQPIYAPNSMYALMKSCWTVTPEERPRFTTVLGQIEKLISAETARYYILLDEPYERFNVENTQLYQSSDVG